MTEDNQKPALVLGASGTQGGAVARALQAQGIPVRAFTRSVETAAKLSAAGMSAVIGDFNDAVALTAACTGVRAVFSMQSAPFADPQSERREGEAIVAAARAAGVPQIVHTSVSGAGAFHRAMKDWGTGRWNENYWDSKADVEDAVRNAGFPFWTILKPAFLMENFILPKVPRFFPHLAEGKLLTAFKPDVALVLVAADDIGAAAAAAILDPERFNHQEIELSGDALTMAQIGADIGQVTGQKIEVLCLSAEETKVAGVSPFWIGSQLWSNEVPYPALPEDSKKLGLSPTKFLDWAKQYVQKA